MKSRKCLTPKANNHAIGKVYMGYTYPMYTPCYGMVYCSMEYVEYTEKEGAMLIDNMLFDQTWFSELSLRHRFLYIYLLTKCTKVGVFEINLRKFTFDLNDGSQVTRDDLFIPFGNRIKPLGDNKGIFVDWLGWNWYRGNPFDPSRNPLHKGLLQELKKYGLDFHKLNDMANKKFTWKEDGDNCIPVACNIDDTNVNSYTNREIFYKMFDEFWKEYPSICPRKVDKKKCLAKYQILLKNAGEKYSELHAKIIAGVRLWKQSEMWQSNGGQYIKAPLVFLNGENWNDNPLKGKGNAVNRQCVKTADNYIGGTVAEADQF